VSTCFACCGPSHELWAASNKRLERCRVCGSEWITGDAGHPEEFWYDDSEPSGLGEALAVRRAGRHIAFLERHRSEGGRLLDVGCGWGAFVRLANAHGWEAAGWEVSPHAAAFLSTRTGLDIRGGDLRDVEVNERWDVITLWGVVEHVQDPQKLLRSVRALLSPGGVIALETPNASALFRLVARVLFHVSHGHVARPFEETLGGGHVAWYSRGGLSRGARALGLTPVIIRASTNDNQMLIQRFSTEPPLRRALYSHATRGLNALAPWVGRPNQLSAVFELPAAASVR
jgi:2-polyprenyl-3-methyl-5-hydroxy-6-metoxy-1,4-benzoquinol methylase